MWSVDGAWGTVEADGEHVRIEVLEGSLRANRFELPDLREISAVKVNGAQAAFTAANGAVVLEEKTLSGVLEIFA